MVLVYAENAAGVFKKNVLEALSYASQIAQKLSLPLGVAVMGASDHVASLEKYGAEFIFHFDDTSLQQYNSRAHAKNVAMICKEKNVQVIVMSHTVAARGIAPRLAASLQAGLVSGAVALPQLENGFVVKKAVFAGKAFANVKINSAIKVISLTPNSVALVENPKTASIEKRQNAFPDQSIQILSTELLSGDRPPLGEAELVVSGGRGLKGPENWGILEDLANSLNATLACSRPVADSHWRPHHEHVGQTGGTIRPNLYIAVGISGAIQHLAGVNASKTIVVINKDPEAPFFKAADYGVVGDAFEVLPKLTEAIKTFKASQAN